MIKAIIYDCFGVIYPDTLSLVVRPYIQNDDPKREQIRQLRKQCDSGLVSRDNFWDETASILGISREELDEQLKKVQNADWELLEYIRNQKRHFKTALLSNVGKGFVERIFLPDKSIGDYFDEVVVSAEIGVLKPDPLAYKITLQRLGCDAAEAIFVDDLMSNIQGAQAQGITSILYTDFDDFKTQLEQILKA